MPKKSAPGHANRGHLSKQAHTQKPGREARPDKTPSLEESHDQKKGRGEGFGNERNGRRKFWGKKLIEAGKSKEGCFPKLFILLLPFVALGAYLLSSS